jgi:hypothetical protein
LEKRTICVIENDENAMLIAKSKAGKVNRNLSKHRTSFK